jgi:Kef-type K+ transport system membrane component KefB
METTTNSSLNSILGVVLIIIAFAVAYAYLKPHNLHKTRPISTLLLKGSYLLYLLILMIIVYVSLLHKGGVEAVFPDIEFFAFLIVLFAPTIGILARKLGQFSKKRENFNYFFTVVNTLCIIALLVMYFV